MGRGMMVFSILFLALPLLVLLGVWLTGAGLGLALLGLVLLMIGFVIGLPMLDRDAI